MDNSPVDIEHFENLLKEREASFIKMMMVGFRSAVGKYESSESAYITTQKPNPSLKPAHNTLNSTVLDSIANLNHLK